PVTGRLEDPDEEMMSEVEKTLGVGAKRDDFRHDIISRIGAWSIDHPNVKPTYSDIFPKHFQLLRESYFEQRKKIVKKTNLEPRPRAPAHRRTGEARAAGARAGRGDAAVDAREIRLLREVCEGGAVVPPAQAVCGVASSRWRSPPASTRTTATRPGAGRGRSA